MSFFGTLHVGPAQFHAVIHDAQEMRTRIGSGRPLVRGRHAELGQPFYRLEPLVHVCTSLLHRLHVMHVLLSGGNPRLLQSPLHFRNSRAKIAQRYQGFLNILQQKIT